MYLYGFKGSDGRYALLAQDNMESLPAEFGPWQKSHDLELNPGDPDRLGVPTAETLANIETHGCHYCQFKMTFE